MTPQELNERDREERRLSVMRLHLTIVFVKVLIAIVVVASICGWLSPRLIDAHVEPQVTLGFIGYAVSLLVAIWAVISVLFSLVRFANSYDSQ